MPRPISTRATQASEMKTLLFFLTGGALVLLFACGETRQPIGEECLRSEDCLSGTCADRRCIAAPGLVRGENGVVPDETPRIPDTDAAGATQDASADAPKDAPGDGG